MVGKYTNPSTVHGEPVEPSLFKLLKEMNALATNVNADTNPSTVHGGLVESSLIR